MCKMETASVTQREEQAWSVRVASLAASRLERGYWEGFCPRNGPNIGLNGPYIGPQRAIHRASMDQTLGLDRPKGPPSTWIAMDCDGLMD